MRKGTRIFLVLLAVLLVAACGSLWQRYAYQRGYQAALENSNFLQWSKTVSAENLEIATISCGYGTGTTKYFLSPEEIEEACEILHSFSTEEISLTNDHKGYAVVGDEFEDINFSLRDQRGEFEFRYRPSNSGELYIRMNSEMADSYKDLNSLWTSKESMIDFMLTHAPAK